MSDLGSALKDIGELLFPMTGELPYTVRDFATIEMAVGFLDLSARVKGTGFDKLPEKPCLVMVNRGKTREPIVLLHGYEFLRLLKKAEWR